jgi:hypothetical protein
MKKISAKDLIMYSILQLIIGLGISWISGTSPNDDGYDHRFFYAGLIITACTAILLLVHLVLDRKVEALGYFGALFVLFLGFGYIPLRMIYWSVPEMWVLVIFPGLIVLAIAFPYLAPETSGCLAKEYIIPSSTLGKKIWRSIILTGPVVGSIGVLIARMSTRTKDFTFLSVIGLLVYLGFLWTIQVNTHKNIYIKKLTKERNGDVSY